MGHRITMLVLGALLALLWAPMSTNAAPPVSNEEIRGTIQSLIYSYNQLDNKLERHEHRERSLGEMMKKAMQSLQKGQKSLEPIHGILARLDERVSQIETMLITQEEKFNGQTEKYKETIDHMFKWMRENDECFKHPPGAVPSGSVVAAVTAAPAASIANEFVQQQQQTNQQLLDELKKLSAQVTQLTDSSQKVAEQQQQSFEKLKKTPVELLEQIETKLQQHVQAPVTAAPLVPEKSEFETLIIDRLGEIKEDVGHLRQAPAPVFALSTEDKAYIHGLNNETLSALAAVKSDSEVANEKVLVKATEQLQQTEANLQAELKQLSTGVSGNNPQLEKFYTELTKFNNIMMTNSEVVLDTQRKVDFGTLNTVQKVSALIEQQLDELKAMLKERFNDVDEAIVATQQEGTKNISALLDTSINQVWHHIQIMSGEIGENTNLLQLMRASKDEMVNSTMSMMLGMGIKVEETKNHMIDMDSNLNFLLGKLSLMSSEFANIKKGLADSLEDLRHSFQMLHERMPTGPGPHNIDLNRYETTT